VTLLYGQLAVTTTCYNNIIVIITVAVSVNNVEYLKQEIQTSFVDILSTCQLHISLTRTAQIYLELRFCVELHTNKAPLISINLVSRGFYTISVNSFSNRIIDKWNQPPEDVVTCTSVGLNSSKNRLD